MGKWSTVADADATGDKKPWFEPGKYRVRITAVLSRESRNKDLWYVVEAEVLKIFNTTNPGKMAVGKIYSQSIKFNQDMGPVNVKRFILAANGFDPNDPASNSELGETPEDVEEAVEFTISDEQPLVGAELELQCDIIKTKAGTDFTKHTWFPT